MPIIRDSLEDRPKQNAANENLPSRPKEENTEPQSRCFEAYDASNFGQETSLGNGQRPESREELIARIKRDQRPIWLQNSGNVQEYTTPNPYPSSTLLPPIELENSVLGEAETEPTAMELASNIERPKSALHAGDFHEQQGFSHATHPPFDLHQQEGTGWTSTSPTDPWFTPAFSIPRHSPIFESRNRHASQHTPSQPRNRAFSQTSLSSSFIIRSPTSPLARASATNDFDDRETERSRSRSPNKSSRRHTFSPRSLRATQYSPTQQTSSFAHGRPFPPLRREETEPYQQRNKRRSFAAASNSQHYSSPQTPISRSRRASILSDGSPLQAPLVGGYEESILRGRMSTLPSRPLDFVAQIGVLGKGECKRSLKCPPHISIPFPAVYYNYGNSREGTSTLDGPSPYVGLIDMEGFSRERDQPTSNGSHRPETPGSDGDINGEDKSMESKSNNPEFSNSQRKYRYRMYSSNASRRPPKGAYRIPQQGQLQIIIKNPNKTAVKLFLIPYDLEGMEAGQKTFIRQRSYSAGPIIDMPLSCRTNLGTDRPEAAITNSTDPQNRPVLRYLIHLHICCPSRGRFYLYKSIRVVFANRVPDGKEKLRNEIQLPEPRYTTFKPNTDPQLLQRSGNNAIPAAEQIAFDQGPPSLPNAHTDSEHHFRLNYSDGGSRIPLPPPGKQTLSFERKILPAVVPEASSNGLGSSHKSDPMQLDPPSAYFSPKPPQILMTANYLFPDPAFDRFDFNNGNGASSQPRQNRSRDHSPSPRNGLLSLQLRDLARNGTSHGDE